MNQNLSHELVVQKLIDALEPIDSVQAMWEIGAVAFERADQYSDIDLMICGDDDKIPGIVDSFERALNDISPIELQWNIPDPAPFGHVQRFYRIANTSPFLVIDAVFVKASADYKYLIPEVHNPPTIYFDKSGVVRPEPFEPEKFLDELKHNTITLRDRFELFQPFVTKEIERNQPIEALGYYQGATLGPLLQLAKTIHSPMRYDFRTRYIYHELPEDLLGEIEPLYFVINLEDLRSKHEAAQMLFYGLYGNLDWNVIAQRISEARNLRDRQGH